MKNEKKHTTHYPKYKLILAGPNKELCMFVLELYEIAKHKNYLFTVNNEWLKTKKQCLVNELGDA